MSLKLDIAVGDQVRIGDVTVGIEYKSGKRARLSLQFPPSVSAELIRRDNPSPEPKDQRRHR